MPLSSNSGRDPRPQQSRSAGKHYRTLGDAPDIGPVPLMQPGSCPHRRRRSGDKAPKRMSHRRLFLLLLVLSLALGGLLLWTAGG